MAAAALIQSDVAEGLGEVAEQAVVVGFFAQEADVVGVGGGSFEGGTSLVQLAGERPALGEPERTDQEGCFVAVEAVVADVAVEQAVGCCRGGWPRRRWSIASWGSWAGRKPVIAINRTAALRSSPPSVWV